jgi:hypothetical protein
VNGTSGTATAISANGAHSCAIQAGGAVVCWGDDTSGASTPPASVDGTSGTASAISAGFVHGCAIQASTGGVICWGDTSAPPAGLDGTSGEVIAIAAGGYFDLAIRAPEPDSVWLSMAGIAALLALARARSPRNLDNESGLRHLI